MLSKRLLARFLRYVKLHTTSDSKAADSGVQPSTERQRNFAAMLATELRAIGLDEVCVTEHAYVCARLNATPDFEYVPSIGLLAHMDTVDEISGENVQPVLSTTDNGDTIVRSDGTTLLGADDKAGIASIITAIEEVIDRKIMHGQIELIFSPDEETGHGMDNVPLDWIQSKMCYTVDGGGLGEIECECFNAYKVTVNFFGVQTHTGTARGKMVNAITMANHFLSMLPQTESPETTDGYLGFYAPMEISGSIEKCCVTLLLRDFDSDGMQRRINAVKFFAEAVCKQFPTGKVETVFTQQYLNMKRKIDDCPEVMNILIRATKNADVVPVIKPIRGGTDGARLAELGIPTPNIFTGGHEFHSRTEWVSLDEMTKSCRTVLELIKIWSLWEPK